MGDENELNAIKKKESFLFIYAGTWQVSQRTDSRSVSCSLLFSTLASCAGLCLLGWRHC